MQSNEVIDNLFSKDTIDLKALYIVIIALSLLFKRTKNTNQLE